MTDPFTAWCELFEHDYGPLLGALSEHFGTPFEIVRTPSAVAIEARQEGGALSIRRYTWECEPGHSGAVVGVYAPAGGEPVSYAANPHPANAEQLIALIREAIDGSGTT